jgi:hypothetical protein
MEGGKFVYTYFGRHFCPSSEMGWASISGRALKSGKMTRVGPGVSLVVKESGSVIGGIDPRTPGLDINLEVVQTGFGLMMDTLFCPPDEPWVGMSFDKTTMRKQALTLNVSKRCVYFAENSGKSVIKVHPLLLAEAAADIKGFPEAKLLALAQVLGKREKLTEQEKLLLDLAPVSAKKAVILLSRHEQPISLLMKYLKWRKDK